MLLETLEIDNIARAGELVVLDLDADEIVARWPLVAGYVSVVWTGSRELCALGPVEGGGQAGFGIFVVGLDDGALRLVTDALDADPIALAAGAAVAAVASGLDTYLARLEDGVLASLGSHTGSIVQLGASRDGSTVAAVLYHEVPNVWAGPPDGELVRVSDLAPELADVEWAPQERLAWRAPDGLELDGLLILPPGRTRADGPFPLVLVLHGGPYSRSGTISSSGGRPRPSGSRLRATPSSVRTRAAAPDTAPNSHGPFAPQWASVTGPMSSRVSSCSLTRALPTQSGSRSGAGARGAT